MNIFSATILFISHSFNASVTHTVVGPGAQTNQPAESTICPCLVSHLLYSLQLTFPINKSLTHSLAQSFNQELNWTELSNTKPNLNSKSSVLMVSGKHRLKAVLDLGLVHGTYPSVSHFYSGLGTAWSLIRRHELPGTHSRNTCSLETAKQQGLRRVTFSPSHHLRKSLGGKWAHSFF